MAINDKKIDIIQTQQPQNVQTSTTGANGTSQTSQSSQPINMKSGTKSDPITETIKTPEFQQLSPQEQLKKLKQLFPDIPEKDLLNTLNTVKSVIEQDSEDNSIVEEIEIEPENENEQSINKVAKELEKSGKKNPSIDDVIAYVKSIPESERTEDQQKMLKYLNELDQKDLKTYTPQELKQILLENSDGLDNLIPKEVLQSKEWQKKSPTDKLDARADAILSKMIPGFDELSEQEKKQYRNGFYNKVGQAINPKWDSYDIETKAKRITNMAVAIDAAEFSNMSIKDVLTADENTISKMAQNYRDNKILASFVNDSDINVNEKEWVKKPGKQQINEIADSILEKIDPKYKKHSAKQQENIKNEWIDNIGRQLYREDWDKLDTFDKNLRKELFAKELSTMKSLNISPEEYLKLSVAERYEKYVEKYEAKNGIKLDPRQQIARDTIKRLNTTQITRQDLIDTLKLKKELTPEENELLKTFETGKNVFGQDASKIKEQCPEDSIDNIVKEKCKGNYKQFINDYILKEYNISIDDLRNNDKAIHSILSHCHDTKTMINICNEIGVDPSKYINETQAIDVASCGLNTGDNKDLNIANKAFHRIGKPEHVDQTSLAVPKYIKDHNTRLEYAEQTAALDVKYTDTIAKSWNNLEFVTTEEAKALGRDFNLSENVSNAAKSTFTKSFVETAANDQIRIEYGQELSKIDNSAVTEGLAAASNSVGEEYRSQYNSYVETAMQNYPPEQQANIRSAMKTGEISQETLSQTTPPSGNNNTEKSSSSSNTDGAQNSNSNAAVNNNTNSTTGNINQNAGNIQETATTSGRTSASNATASAYNNTAAQTQSFTSQLKQQTVTEPTYSTASAADTSVSTKSSSPQSTSQIQSEDNFTAEALQAKKDAVAQNIQNYQNHVEETTRQQENQLSDEDIQTIDQVFEYPQNMSLSEEEKIRQVFQKVGTNVNAIYSIIINKYGSQAQDKFLEILASNGSSANIRSFVNGMTNDPSVIKKLYTYCSNQKLKSELLNMLPINDIISMISAGQIKISDLGTNNYKRVFAELKISDPDKLNEFFGEFESHIEDKISSGYSLNNSDRQQLRDYLETNIDSISNTKFARYLQYLSIDDREALVAMKNSPKKTAQSNEPQAVNQDNIPQDSDKNTQNKTIASETSAASVQDSNSNKSENKQDNTIAQHKPQPIFEDHEMTKVLNDGTKVKRKESFGAISNNTDMYDDYEEISQVSENPSMEDPVLTPGSYEWQLKYNRQMAYQPVTQPTLTPADEDGILLGSNKVSPRLQIDKMKRRGPFYFNA